VIRKDQSLDQVSEIWRRISAPYARS